MNLRYLQRRSARPAHRAPAPRTGCTCVVAHALTKGDKQVVLDAIALADANGEADLIGYLEMRLNTDHCPAASKEAHR